MATMVGPWLTRVCVAAVWVGVGCGPQAQPTTATAADGGSRSSGAASIDAIDDGLHVFVGAVPPQADEVWTVEFDVPCSRVLGAPKIDLTRFDVPAIVGISVPGKFEYTLVGRYRALVDVEHVTEGAQLLVHELAVEPEPLAPAGGPPFAWDALLHTGYVAD